QQRSLPDAERADDQAAHTTWFGETLFGGDDHCHRGSSRFAFAKIMLAPVMTSPAVLVLGQIECQLGMVSPFIASGRGQRRTAPGGGSFRGPCGPSARAAAAHHAGAGSTR